MTLHVTIHEYIRLVNIVSWIVNGGMQTSDTWTVYVAILRSVVEYNFLEIIKKSSNTKSSHGLFPFVQKLAYLKSALSTTHLVSFLLHWFHKNKR